MEPKRRLNTLKDYLNASETPIERATTESKTHLLTDRRLLTISTADSRREKTTVHSYHLDLVDRATVTHKSGIDTDDEKLMAGILAIGLALVSAIFIGPAGSDLGAFLVLVALGAGLVGILLLIEAISTDPGSVTIELKTEGEWSWSASLPEDQLDFATAVSRTVAGSVDPAQVKRKVD